MVRSNFKNISTTKMIKHVPIDGDPRVPHEEFEPVASIKDAYMVTSLTIGRLQSHHVSDAVASHGNQSAVLLDATDHNEYI